MRSGTWRALVAIGALGLASLLSGCAGMEFAPKNTIWYYHKELPAADRAVQAARNAGKDKECPEDFKAAEKMKNDAYDIYWSCRTQEGIAKANEATAKANGLCPMKAEAPAPPPPPAPAPPPPPPMAAPSVSLAASPSVVDQGKCTTLNWSSENASSASIEPGIGPVVPSGSREVCPGATTLYTITAQGEGGSKTATSTVTVNPAPAAPVVIDRLVVHINFDTDKADIRKADLPELQKAIDFVKKYPDYKVSVDGHTDNRGSAKYNQKLSEKRAAAVKKYLVDKGAAEPGAITSVGYGKTRPIADNKTEKGRFENRRVEILIMSR